MGTECCGSALLSTHYSARSKRHAPPKPGTLSCRSLSTSMYSLASRSSRVDTTCTQRGARTARRVRRRAGRHAGRRAEGGCRAGAGRVQGWGAGRVREGDGAPRLAELDEGGAEAEEAVPDELGRRGLGGAHVGLRHALLRLARLGGTPGPGSGAGRGLGRYA